MRIVAITGIRSDYDLMSPLFQLLNADPATEFKLLVGGAHMSDTFGYSLKQITDDGFELLHSIESLLDANSHSARLKSMSIFLQSAVDAVRTFQPDLILFAGDREDVIMGGLLGAYLDIPTAHFYGGDHMVNGHVDNLVRHATSKLSTVHFVTLDEHKRRLQSIGEAESRIFPIGNLSLDRFLSHTPMSKGELLSKFSLGQEFTSHALLMFHPTSLDVERPEVVFENILLALKTVSVSAFVGYPNVDPGNFEVRKVIEKYQHDPQFFFYKNLDRDTYLSIYKRSQFVIGNSSSAVCEAASIPIPAVNIGERQKGRFSPENIIHSGVGVKDIVDAIVQARLMKDASQLLNLDNPYGDGRSAIRAFDIIANYDFKSYFLKTEDPLA